MKENKSCDAEECEFFIFGDCQNTIPYALACKDAQIERLKNWVSLSGAEPKHYPVDYENLPEQPEQPEPKQEEYKKYEFCKSMKCFRLDSHGCETYDCPYTAKDFQKFLKEKDYKIIKEKP